MNVRQPEAPERPGHVKCIRSPREPQKHALCGRPLDVFEFVLTDIDHAYMLGDRSRFQVCTECVDEAVRGLEAMKYEETL